MLPQEVAMNVVTHVFSEWKQIVKNNSDPISTNHFLVQIISIGKHPKEILSFSNYLNNIITSIFQNNSMTSQSILNIGFVDYLRLFLRFGGAISSIKNILSLQAENNECYSWFIPSHERSLAKQVLQSSDINAIIRFSSTNPCDFSYNLKSGEHGIIKFHCLKTEEQYEYNESFYSDLPMIHRMITPENNEQIFNCGGSDSQTSFFDFSL